MTDTRHKSGRTAASTFGLNVSFPGPEFVSSLSAFGEFPPFEKPDFYIRVMAHIRLDFGSERSVGPLPAESWRPPG